MSGSKQTSKSVQTKDPYSPAKPVIDQSVAGVGRWLSDPSSFAAYQGGMSDRTSAGLDNLAASSGANQSRDYLSDVLSGKFLAADNPWQADLDASIRAAVMPSINSTFSNAGMSGSTLHQGSVSQGLTSALAAPRYQQYQNERAAMGQAAGLLPQVDDTISKNLIGAGQTEEGYDRAQFDENRIAGLRPYLETQGLLGTYGNMGGTASGTTTTKSKTPIGEQIIGAGMTGFGLMSGVPGFGGGGIGGYAPQGSLPWQSGYNPVWGYMTGN